VEHKLDGLIHWFKWAEYDLAATVNRVEENKWGGITGNVHIWRPEKKVEMALTTLSMMSENSKLSLLKRLAQRDPKVNWANIVDSMCMEVVLSYQQGEPALDLSEQEIVPCQYLIKPLLLKGEVNLVYGEGQSGKSMTADYACTLLSLPESHNGLDVDGATCLYLDWETSKEVHARRTAWIARGMGVPRPSIHYRRMTAPLADDLYAVRNLVERHDIDFIVLDSGLGASGGDIEKPTDPGRLFAAIRTLGVTTLIITHKAKSVDAKTPYGNVFWFNFSRNIFEVRGARNGVTNTIGFYHKKANDDTLAEPFALTFHYDTENEIISVSRGDIESAEELTEGMSHRERIRTELRDGSLAVEDISERTGIAVASVKTILYRNKHWFVKPKKSDLWGLVTTRLDGN